MVQLRIAGRNVASVISLVALFIYVAYFTSELYSRLNSIQKLQRLHEYERELQELTRLLHQYKSDSKVVSESISLLQEVISKMADSSKDRRAHQLMLKTQYFEEERQTKTEDSLQLSHKSSLKINNRSHSDAVHRDHHETDKEVTQKFVYHPEQILQRDQFQQVIPKPRQFKESSLSENSIR
ncbi:hypothetical protein FHG87_006830 [Trinorchestia longiramus]|nr:hypothetical protein FHG87_006830 [Trinorchestia longiramus]